MTYGNNSKDVDNSQKTLNDKKIISSIWFLDGNITGTNTPDQSGPDNNGNEGVHHITYCSRIGASPLYDLVTLQGH